MKQNLLSPTDDRPQKPKLHISQNDFIDIADVATPVVCDEIEEQMENPEYYEIVVDKKINGF